MRKSYGGLFFLSAAVLLAVTGAPDIFTVAAVVVCVLLAGLAATEYRFWSAVGAGAVIGASLSLQAVLSYRCLDCIKADVLLLAGMACLSLAHRGGMKSALRGMSLAMAVLMAIHVALHYPLAGREGAEAAGEGEIERYIAATVDGRGVTLDTRVRPVLFFSPTCGPCKDAVGELIKIDPEGKDWVPVQAGGDPEAGLGYLRRSGYRGSLYRHSWSGPVPVLFWSGEGKTMKIHGLADIKKTVGGESG
jgi:hypothetical protein